MCTKRNEVGARLVTDDLEEKVNAKLLENRRSLEKCLNTLSNSL
jgi:hypothetical protein